MQLDEIKKLVIIAMFSDDELMEHLVLKGGNALDIIHQISSRASLDIDFSMETDFPGGKKLLHARAERALRDTFRAVGYEAFDIKIEDRPPTVTNDMADFWGGYMIEFKLIGKAEYEQMSSDIAGLRRRAIHLGQGSRFLIDISKFEYTYGKEAKDLDGYRIFVYSAEMIVCEKLRAICQQMPEYGAVVKRQRPGTPRARDFLDIYILTTERNIDIASAKNAVLLTETFRAKRVELSLLGAVENYREFHRTDFPAVQATVKPGILLKSFDFYFDHVLGLIERLKSLWNK